MQQGNVSDGLLRVVDEAYLRGFTLQSEFARRNAELVAVAASKSLITTEVGTKASFGRTWRVTSKGLRLLNEHKETNDNDS